MRKCRTKIISTILALVMAFGCLSGFKEKVKASLPELQNVQISENGIVTWDAFDGAVDYDWSIYSGGGICKETSVDLKDFCSMCCWKNGTYTVSIYARDAEKNAISETWTGTYTYVSDHAQLATPSNIQWTGNVMTWDPVPYATRYRVGFKYGSWEYATTNSYDFSNYAPEAPTAFEIYIVAEAPGYPESEPYEETAWLCESRPDMSNVSISADGILSWDAFPGAAQYDWSLGSGGGYIKETSLDLDYYMLLWDKDPGTYDIKLFALDENGKRLTTFWMGTYTYAKPECKTITIIDGYADLDEAPEGMTITINANDKENYTFDHWQVTTGGVTLANASEKQTTFVMGDKPVRVDAKYTYTGPYLSTFDVECDEPVGGRNPSKATINTTDYKITSSEWIDVETNAVLSATDTFVAGKEYKLQWTLQTTNYPFDYENAVCYLNGSSEGITYPTAIVFVLVCEKTFTAKAFTVDFDTKGGSSVPSQSVSAGEHATHPSSWPYKTGYVFVDWCSDEDCTTSFDFDNTAINADTTVYAKFVEIDAAITVGDFDDVYVGYTPASSQVSFQIKNEAIINPARLHMEITGNNASAFTSEFRDSGMEYGPGTFENNFKITPDELLKIGTYTATATLYYDTDADGVFETKIASDDFSYTVKEITGSISFEEFNDVTVGYGEQEYHVMNLAIEDESVLSPKRMSLYISGTNADAFEYGYIDSGNLEGPGIWYNGNFWVRPVTGLPEGTYEATATLQYDSDNNNTPDATIGSCTLRFTVNPIPLAKYTVTYDANGGITGAAWKGSEELIEGMVIKFTAPTEDVIKAPEGKEFAGYEVDGVEIPINFEYPVTKDISVKYLWKDVEVTPEPPTPEPPTPEPPTPEPPTPEPQPATPEPTKEPSFEDFIERMYVVALNRESEPEGKAFWMDKVKNEGFTGGRVAIGFLIEAPEFLNRGLTDEQFVEVLYKTFFDREADEGGKAFWMGHLASDMTREQVVRGFIDSTEWCNLCASFGIKSGAPNAKAEKPSSNALKFATRLYTCCLGREPDADGLQFWALRLTNLESSGASAAKGFFESQEFQNLNVNDVEYLTRLYRTFMGREPDEGGMTFWLGHLATDMTREQVLKGFAESEEFTNICNQYGIERGTL